MILTGGNVFSVTETAESGRVARKGYFEKKDVFIDSERHFCSEPEPGDGHVMDVSGSFVIPGLVDVHTHGSCGYDFCDASEEGLKKIAAYQFASGVTSFCPTSMTYPEKKLARIFASAGCVPDDGRHACVTGIHMEGPYIAMGKRGAQNASYIMDPDIDMLLDLMEVAAVPIRLVTLAPELPGANDFIRYFREKHKEVHISLGHSTADYETAGEAFHLGADHVTHLYNAMQPFGHRQPGIIGAAVQDRQVFVELICDGIHVHPAVIRASFAMFGPDRVVLISDSMRATGLADGESELGGQLVYKEGPRATLKDGTLAGSVSNLMTCMRRAVEFGIPLEDAVLAATSNPAHSIGLGDFLGVIAPGARGNLVILSQDLDIVKVI